MIANAIRPKKVFCVNRIRALQKLEEVVGKVEPGFNLIELDNSFADAPSRKKSPIASTERILFEKAKVRFCGKHYYDETSSPLGLRDDNLLHLAAEISFLSKLM